MKYYRKGFISHIPEFFLPKFKPNIIDEIIRDDNIIGKVAGINLKTVDFNEANDINSYIKTIEKLPMEGYTRLYIEGMEEFDEKIRFKIEEELGLKILDGRNTKFDNLSFVLGKIYDYLKDSLEEKEVLIVSNDKEVTKNTIKEIGKVAKLITITGCNKEENEEIYEDIFEEIGLSIFCPNKIEKIIGNYSIIVNLMDNGELDFSGVRKSLIIFNFSRCEIPNRNNRLAIIEDFGFELKDIGIKKNKWINNKISTSLYEGLLGTKPQKIRYIYSKNQYYSIKDYVNLNLMVKGRL